MGAEERESNAKLFPYNSMVIKVMCLISSLEREILHRYHKPPQARIIRDRRWPRQDRRDVPDVYEPNHHGRGAHREA